jgi:hypothetical protein
MHYKNGRPANEGDPVFKPGDQWGPPVAGKLVGINAGTTTCNGHIISNRQIQELPIVTIGECYHADDVVVPPAPPAP